MATLNYEWVRCEEPIRISQFASDLGFNLRTLDYNGISSELWNSIDGKIRNSIMDYIDECWAESGQNTQPLSQVRQGIYAITLGDNLSIDYNGNPSKVLYIGRGHIRSRIYNHLKLWVRYLSDSLQDISLEVWMAEVKVRGVLDAYKEVESDLLSNYYDSYGVYPLQNNKSGDRHDKSHEYDCDWRAPLKKPTNIQHGWSIRPLSQNPWCVEFEEV